MALAWRLQPTEGAHETQKGGEANSRTEHSRRETTLMPTRRLHRTSPVHAICRAASVTNREGENYRTNATQHEGRKECRYSFNRCSFSYASFATPGNVPSSAMNKMPKEMAHATPLSTRTRRRHTLRARHTQKYAQWGDRREKMI